MYGLEPTDGVAYNAYMPILQSAFAVSGPSPTTTTTRTSTTTSKATTAPTTTTRATSATTTKTSSSPAPTGNCAAKWSQCGVSIEDCRIQQCSTQTDRIPGHWVLGRNLLRQWIYLQENERILLAMLVGADRKSRSSRSNGTHSCEIEFFPLWLVESLTLICPIQERRRIFSNHEQFDLEPLTLLITQFSGLNLIGVYFNRRHNTTRSVRK